MKQIELVQKKILGIKYLYVEKKHKRHIID